MTGEVRTIEIGALTRVEGEGAVKVFVREGRVEDVQLSIYEPPRFFESLLIGRPLEETPDIVARICGICPVAYQMTCVHALELILGIEISAEIRHLRRLLYCGEWIESHGVHMHLLHIPDFFGCSSSLELARKFPDEVKRGLRLKKIGNQLVEVLGGRAAHPVSVAVGGFYRSPQVNDLRKLAEAFRWGIDASIDVVKWIADFEFPEWHRPCEMVALQNTTEYPMNEGFIATTNNAQAAIRVADFEQVFREYQVDHSTALHSQRVPSNSAYLVGPLARINLNRPLLAPCALQLSEEVNVNWPCFNPFQSIIARALESLHAYETGLQLIQEYGGCSPSRFQYEPCAGEATWATEAPRGLLYQRIRTTADGKIEFAKIVPPTSQNQRQIELDLIHQLATRGLTDDPTTTLACERLVRSYDPCISCSTHFLKLEIHNQ
ncbi:MAG: Ni/Fe hydrogenase subunit alpha [Planctomycetales bacterium]|nr:Ni/Fe hydrogenase subunit alpha [Planctomycetales bacterium]